MFITLRLVLDTHPHWLCRETGTDSWGFGLSTRCLLWRLNNPSVVHSRHQSFLQVHIKCLKEHLVARCRTGYLSLVTRQKYLSPWPQQASVLTIVMTHINLYLKNSHQESASYPFSSIDASVNTDADAQCGQAFNLFQENIIGRWNYLSSIESWLFLLF